MRRVGVACAVADFQRRSVVEALDCVVAVARRVLEHDIVAGVVNGVVALAAAYRDVVPAVVVGKLAVNVTVFVIVNDIVSVAAADCDVDAEVFDYVVARAAVD